MSQHPDRYLALILALLVSSLAFSGCRPNEHTATEKKVQQESEPNICQGADSFQ